MAGHHQAKAGGNQQVCSSLNNTQPHVRYISYPSELYSSGGGREIESIPTCRYNPDNMETLEQYAQFQAESHHYDFEANLTLMKL